MQCHGHRCDGASFLAQVWFSTYREGTTPKLAAIIADLSEERVAADGHDLSSEHKDRPTLNNRELYVLRLVVQGLSNKEISSQMDVSESAVKNTLQQLFAKTAVRTRSQLVRVAIERYRDLI
jgi:two-component system nitrate/nitrite response regulator NarL